MAKAKDAFRTISEVSETVGVPQHVLRFWETKFKEVAPLKRGGGRRYYRPDDVALLQAINGLLYTDGYTIKGVQKLLKENGATGVIEDAGGLPAGAPDAEGGAHASPLVGEAPAAVSPGAAPIDAAFLRDLRQVRDRLEGALSAARID